jgi:hypothetical protein
VRGAAHAPDLARVPPAKSSAETLYRVRLLPGLDLILSADAGAIARAAAERTSTRVSSISWMISRTTFSGSSALSSIALMLELMMSLILEKTPMSAYLVMVKGPRRA